MQHPMLISLATAIVYDSLGIVILELLLVVIQKAAWSGRSRSLTD